VGFEQYLVLVDERFESFRTPRWRNSIQKPRRGSHEGHGADDGTIAAGAGLNGTDQTGGRVDVEMAHIEISNADRARIEMIQQLN